MKILFFTDYYRPEPPPPAHHIAERAAIWQRAGHQVTIVTNHPNYPEGRIYPGFRNRLRSIETTPDGVRVVRVWTYIAGHARQVLKLADHASYCSSAVAQALRETRPDVVVATSPHLFAGLAGAMYARLVRRPLLMEIRDLWPDQVLAPTSPAFKPFKTIERFLYRSAHTVSVMTPLFVDHVKREGAARVSVVVGGTDLTRFAPGPKPAHLVKEAGLDGHFVVGYPGTLGTGHDIELIAKAGERLRGSRVKLLFIGGGPHMERLKSLVASTCPEVFSFVPTQPADRMPEWWRAMDAGLVLLHRTKELSFVVPSKMFESMASGKPIVFVGPRGAGSQIVDSAGAGPIVDDGDPQSVASAMLQLAGNPALHQRLSDSALKAAPQYSRERHAQETLDLLLHMQGAGRTR